MIQLRLRVRAECVCCLNAWLPVLRPQLRKTRSLLTRIRMPSRLRNQLVTRNQKNLKRVTDYYLCNSVDLSGLCGECSFTAIRPRGITENDREFLGMFLLVSCFERLPFLSK